MNNRGRYVTYSISYFDWNGKVKGTSMTHFSYTVDKSIVQDTDAINEFYHFHPECEIIGFTKSYHNTK